MKTLLVSSQYPPLEAGVPNYNYNLSKNMSADEFCLLTSSIPDSEEVDKKLLFSVYRNKFLTNYKLSYSFMFFLRHFSLFFCLIRIIRKEKVDLVIQGESRPFLMLLSYFALKLLSVPYIVIHHGDGANPDKKRKTDVLVKFLLHKSQGVIANSFFSKDRIVRTYDVPPENIFVLTPGVDTDLYTTGVDSSPLVERHSLQDRVVIMTVGRLDKRKGHDHVIMSLPKIVKQIPNLLYLIVGEGDDRARLEALVKKENMSDHVLFAGTVALDDLPLYYNCCELFIMANRIEEDGDSEGFGMVFIEAGACGKAVIAGRFGGAVEAVEEGVSGIFTDAMDPNVIAQSVVGLLLNTDERVQLGVKGRQRVLGEFSWEIKRQEFKKLLDSFSDSKGLILE